MSRRTRAFGLHLAASACALSLILGGFYVGWYRWPGWYLAGVAHVVLVMVAVDVVLGPTLTLVIANPRKPLRELVRDVAIIATVQLIALGYGAVTLWLGRPLYYTFSVDCLQLVQASDIDPADAALARQRNPEFAPHWHDLPRHVWAPLPEDSSEAAKIVESATLGSGKDVVNMPVYFKPWSQGLAKLREQLKPVDKIKYLNEPEKHRAEAEMRARSLDPAGSNALIVWGNSVRMVAVFDPATLNLIAFLIPD